MYDYLKSSGGHSYICSLRYIDATTVRTSHHGAMGARECTDEGKGLASTDRQLHMFVYVVWCYLSPESRKQCQGNSEIKAMLMVLICHLHRDIAIRPFLPVYVYSGIAIGEQE